MNKIWLTVFVVLALFCLSNNLFSQDQSGVDFSYVHDLPESALGQAFYWTWKSNVSNKFKAEISFYVNNKEIGGQSVQNLDGEGTLSLGVAPVPMNDSDKVVAFYGVVMNKVTVFPGGKKKLAGGGTRLTYYGDPVAGVSEDKWPSIYVGTPLRVVLKDEVIGVGQKELLAESTRSNDSSQNKDDASDPIHEFSVYIEIVNSPPRTGAQPNTNISAP